MTYLREIEKEEGVVGGGGGDQNKDFNGLQKQSTENEVNMIYNVFVCKKVTYLHQCVLPELLLTEQVYTHEMNGLGGKHTTLHHFLRI